MSKISLKYIPIHIYNFEHSRGIMNMKLSSHGFLFHRNINRRENKVQIPLIIHHNEKNQRIDFWCAAKDNWASQISEVALTKELEQWKFPFPPSGQFINFPKNTAVYFIVNMGYFFIPVSCVSCVPASCFLIWFVSCPRLMWLLVNSCPAVFVSLSMIIPCI